MRAVEPWVEPPLRRFLDESGCRLVLLMTGAGQVVAQHGFVRAVDVMSAAALGAGAVASTMALGEMLGEPGFGTLVHQGGEQQLLVGSFDVGRGRWIALATFGRETTAGLVQLFFRELVRELAEVAPAAPAVAPMRAETFERDLDANLRALFGG